MRTTRRPARSRPAAGSSMWMRCAAADRKPKGLVTATRGNHGQSIALAAARNGVPVGDRRPRRQFAREERRDAGLRRPIGDGRQGFRRKPCRRGANPERARLSLRAVVSPRSGQGRCDLCARTVQSFADLDVVYVPIGMGSGICGLITVRDLLGLKTEIVGVVAENAPAFALSFDAGRPVPTNAARTFADGVACRDPQAEAFDIIKAGAARVVRVSEDEIAEAIRIYYTTTHNLAEGAGAAPLAALLKEKDRYAGKRAGLILTGGNIDMPLFAQVLRGETPAA